MKRQGDAVRERLKSDKQFALAVEMARGHAALSRELYARRTAAGLTQAQLAELVGTKQSVVARLEDADYEGHSFSLVQRIGFALGYRVLVEFYRFANGSANQCESSEAQWGSGGQDSSSTWQPTINQFILSQPELSTANEDSGA